jgi:hypothetical protein
MLCCRHSATIAGGGKRPRRCPASLRTHSPLETCEFSLFRCCVARIQRPLPLPASAPEGDRPACASISPLKLVNFHFLDVVLHASSALCRCRPAPPKVTGQLAHPFPLETSEFSLFRCCVARIQRPLPLPASAPEGDRPACASISP